MARLFTFLLILAELSLSGQFNSVNFYSQRQDSLSLNEGKQVPAFAYQVTAGDAKFFAECVKKHLKDISRRRDFIEEGGIFSVLNLNIPRDSENKFQMYVRTDDVYDSVRVLVAFWDSINFFAKGSTPRHLALEKQAKSVIYESYILYKNRELDELEDVYDEAEDRVKDLSGDISDKERSILRKQKKIDENREDDVKKRRELSEILDDISQKRHALARAQEEERREEIQDAIKDLERKHRRTESDITNINEDILDLEKEISELRIEITQLRNNLSRARIQSEGDKRNYDNMKALIQNISMQ